MTGRHSSSDTASIILPPEVMTSHKFCVVVVRCTDKQTRENIQEAVGRSKKTKVYAQMRAKDPGDGKQGTDAAAAAAAAVASGGGGGGGPKTPLLILSTAGSLLFLTEYRRQLHCWRNIHTPARPRQRTDYETLEKKHKELASPSSPFDGTDKLNLQETRNREGEPRLHRQEKRGRSRRQGRKEEGINGFTC